MVQTTSQFITVREAAQMMAVSEKKIMELIEQRNLQAYKIAEKFLRLKKNEVLSLKNSGDIAQESIQISYNSGEKIADFFYFNDFYILSALVICFLIFTILYT